MSGASVTTRGSGRSHGSASSTASDFTDFLSDDSEYELQKQAEERVVQIQKIRVERAEDREWRDARRGLDEAMETEMRELEMSLGMMGGVGGGSGGGVGGSGGYGLGSMNAVPPMTATRLGNTAPPVGGRPPVSPQHSGDAYHSQGQTVYVGRYR